MDNHFTTTYQLPPHSFVFEILDEHGNVISCDGLYLLVLCFPSIINVKQLLLQAKDTCLFSIRGVCEIA